MSDTKGFRGHLATVLVVGAIAIGFMIFLLTLSGAVTFNGSYDVRAIVPEAGSLTQGTSVTMAGLRVGTVAGVSRRGNGALVDLRLDNTSVTPIPRNSTVSLRVRTPLGENYVEINPGTSAQKLPSGGLILMNQTTPYVDVDQILSMLQGQTRDRARQLIQSLGGALQNRGSDLNSMLAATSSLLDSGSNITGTLVGDRAQIAALVQQLGDVSSAIGQRSASIQGLAEQGLTTLRAVAAQDASVRSFLSVLPGTLTQVRSTTDLLGSVSNSATPVVANLARALTDLRPAIVNLAPAAREGRAVVRAAASASPPLQHTLASITAASPQLTPALPQLTKVVCQVNPVLRYLRPYTADLINFIAGFGAAVNSYDAISHTIRLLPVFNDSSAMGLPASVSNAADKLVHEGFLEKINGLNYDPYPGPNLANSSFSGGTELTGPAGLAASGYKYPHVVADC